VFCVLYTLLHLIYTYLFGHVIHFFTTLHIIALRITSLSKEECNGTAFLLKRAKSTWAQFRMRAKLFWLQTFGFFQHLEPRACVGNDSVVFPHHMRNVKKKVAPRLQLLKLLCNAFSKFGPATRLRHAHCIRKFEIRDRISSKYSSSASY
jgi:hypothetical protein